MNILLIGGYGQFGRPTAKQLVGSDLVETVTIAGRNLEKAQQAAEEVGPKARAIRLDAEDSSATAEALGAGDVLVSFMWDQKRYQELLIRAAIQAGAHYCDLRSHLPSPELDAAARAAGVSALIGVGSDPGLTSLMDKMALSLLDEVDQVVSGYLWALLQDIWDDIYRAYFKLPGGLDRGPNGRKLRATLGTSASQEQRLEAIRDGRVVEMFLTLLSGHEPPRVEVPAVRGGVSITVDPLMAGVDMPLDGARGGFASLPVIAVDPPGELNDTPRINVDMAGLAQPFTNLLHALASQLRAEELEFDAAVAMAHRRLAADLDSYLLDPALFAAMPGYFISVYGRIEGRSARAAAWDPQPFYTQGNWLDLTAANVAVSVFRLLRGDINTAGAQPLAKMDAMDDAYIAEVTSLLPEVPAGLPLVDKRIEFLD